jgi:hypothetical protein
MAGRNITLVLLAGLICLTRVGSARAELCPLPAEDLSYSIFNDDTEVGDLNLVFDRKSDQTMVSISMDILVRVLFFKAYSFSHTSQEIWTGDGLKTLSARTDDNGDNFSIAIKRLNQTQEITSNEGRVEHPGVRLTELIWCEGAARGGKIISTLTGHIDDIPINFLGEEEIDVNGQTTKARHYRFVRKKRVGDFWYDVHGKLLKLAYPTRYYSTARFVRKNIGSNDGQTD